MGNNYIRIGTDMTTLIPKFDLKNGGAVPAGAVNRPINEKLSETVSVLDFGADPTGVADNAAIFQSVFDLAFANNFEVYIPAGTYKIASVLTLTTDAYGNGLVITGSGFKTTVLSFTGTGFMQSNQTQVNDYITLSDLTLYNTSSSATMGMDIGTVRNGYFENVNVANFLICWAVRKNIDAIGNYYNRFFSCVGDANVGAGSVAWQFGNNIVGHTINEGNANTLVACKSFNAEIGIEIIAGYGNSITGHQATVCPDSGVVITAGSNNYIECYVEGSTSLGNAGVNATQNTLMLFNDGATSTAFVDSNGWNIVTANASVDSAGALPKYTISNNKIVDQISVITAVGATINVFKIKLPDVNCAVKVSATVAGFTFTVDNWAGVQTWDLIKTNSGTPTATAKTTTGNYTITATPAANGEVTFSIAGNATLFTSVQMCVDIQGIASYGSTGFSTQITYTRLI